MGFVSNIIGSILGIGRPQQQQAQQAQPIAQPYVAPPVSAPTLDVPVEPVSTIKKPIKSIGKASLTIPTGTSQGTTGLNI